MVKWCLCFLQCCIKTKSEFGECDVRLPFMPFASTQRPTPWIPSSWAWHRYATDLSDLRWFGYFNCQSSISMPRLCLKSIEIHYFHFSLFLVFPENRSPPHRHYIPQQASVLLWTVQMRRCWIVSPCPRAATFAHSLPFAHSLLWWSVLYTEHTQPGL